jgi:hypothetical protein
LPWADPYIARLVAEAEAALEREARQEGPAAPSFKVRKPESREPRRRWPLDAETALEEHVL